MAMNKFILLFYSHLMLWLKYDYHSKFAFGRSTLKASTGHFSTHLKQAETHPPSSGPFEFSSVAQLCPTLCDPMDCSTPGFPVNHQLPGSAQTHVHWVSDATQPSHPLLSPSPPAFSLSQHQDLFLWISSSRQVAEVLELQLQHQSFQWIFRTDFL